MVDLVVRAQASANNTLDWLKDYGMVVAPDKSKLLIMGNRELLAARSPTLTPSITVDIYNIEATKSEKLLGVVLDADCSCKSHIWGERWRKENN